jgi:hypothetical protein
MNVVIISKADYAGSGQQMAIALRSAGHSATLASFSPNPYNYPIDLFISSQNDLKKLNALIEAADVVHFKGDHLPNEKNFPGVKFQGKPLVLTLGGSGFRRKEKFLPICVAYQWHSLQDYAAITPNINVLTPDLIYTELPCEWLPHAFEEMPNVWEPPKDGVIIIGHSPSIREKKGTDSVFLPFLRSLQRNPKFKIEGKIIEGLSNVDCMAKKAKCHLFFDQGLIPAYGRSAVEAMAMGIPVITRLPNEKRNVDIRLKNSPVIGFEMPTSQSALQAFFGQCDNLSEISKQTHSYARTVHGFDAIISQLVEIYKKAIKCNH